MQDELVERVAAAMENTTMDRWGRLCAARAIIPIVAKWRRERDAGIALSKYDPRNRNGAREWDEWVWAAGQIAAAIRGAE